MNFLPVLSAIYITGNWRSRDIALQNLHALLQAVV